LSCLLLSNDNS